MGSQVRIFWVPKHYLLSGACGVKHLILEAKIILNNLSLCRETDYKRGQAVVEARRGPRARVIDSCLPPGVDAEGGTQVL